LVYLNQPYPTATANNFSTSFNPLIYQLFTKSCCRSSCPDIENLYILVKDKSELESQCRRIFAEMSDLSPDSLDLQFIFN